MPAHSLDAQGVSRRGLLRRAGLYGAGFAGGLALAPTAAAAAEAPRTATGGDLGGDPDFVYLVGDHHVHSVYSHDAKYTASQQARRAAQFGLDWMVFTEHSSVGGPRAAARRLGRTAAPRE